MEISLKINESFSTTVEMIGPTDASRAVLCSHGFGVGRDDRGLFTDLAHALASDRLFVLFDYFEPDGRSLTVSSYDQTIQTFEKVYDYVVSQLGIDHIDVICHSMGCSVLPQTTKRGMVNILLAPPIAPGRERFPSRFGITEDQLTGPPQMIDIVRSDGSVTSVSTAFMDQYTRVDFVQVYGRLEESSTHYVIAGRDEVLGDADVDYASKYLPRARVDTIGLSDHNFTGSSRGQLAVLVAGYLGLDAADDKIHP